MKFIVYSALILIISGCIKNHNCNCPESFIGTWQLCTRYSIHIDTFIYYNHLENEEIKFKNNCIQVDYLNGNKENKRDFDMWFNSDNSYELRYDDHDEATNTLWIQNDTLYYLKKARSEISRYIQKK